MLFRDIPMRKRGAAFWFLAIVAVWTAINGLVADWNYTHLLNPAWGPHAKFHDFVSDMAGVYCGLAALFYLFRRGARSPDDLQFAVVVQTIFWISLLSGFLWPGTGGTASEHPEFVPKVLGIRLNEVFISITSLAALWITYPFERRRRAQ